MHAQSPDTTTTVELPIVTDDEADAEAERAAERRRRSTPVLGRSILGETRTTSEVPALCTDPSYVQYLERSVVSARDEAESARAVFAAVGAHNADLTTENERLRQEVARLMAKLVEAQWALYEADALRKK